MNYPCTLSLFLADGTVEGLKIIKKSNWNGCGMAFPRLLFPKHRERSELMEPGVYLLLGTSDGSDGKRRLYVGEGDPLISRLESHYREKDWWSEAIVFTATDRSLNKAFIQFFESELIQQGCNSARFEMDNNKKPVPRRLSETDRATCKGFMGEVQLCLPVLGVNLDSQLFSALRSDEQLYIRAKGLKAIGMEVSDGFVIMAGSEVALEETTTIPANIQKLRKTMFDEGTLQKTENLKAIFSRNHRFGSPSTASSVILGSSSNGRDLWKNINGESLKSIQLRRLGS